MSFFNALTMLGGLALFLFGMNSLGDGLAKLSGGKLENILERLTANKIKAVLLGAGNSRNPEFVGNNRNGGRFC